MNPSGITWVKDASHWPVAFAQVREDSDIDQFLAKGIGRKVRALIVGSGGCTAAALVASGHLSALHFVDPNPAQLALVRVKLHMLQTMPPSIRLALLGHRSMTTSERRARIASLLKDLVLPDDVFGPAEVVAKLGLDHVGRYEHLFRALRQALSKHSEDLKELTSLCDPAEQSRRVDPNTPLGTALDQAFDDVMSLDNLVALFGTEATANRVEDFSRHFARRTRHVLASQPAISNPWLAQLLVGDFGLAPVYPWITAPAPPNVPDITWSQATMQTTLASAGAATWDFIHLSNILDWLTPDTATGLLEVAWTALAPGGRVVIRQLNSTLKIPEACPKFTWLQKESAYLHAIDRSFFYRLLHVGTKN